MNRRSAFIVLAMAVTIATAVKSGHELPVYPSYYPHEIELRALTREQAADALLGAKIQAHVGALPHFSGPVPESIHIIESLGAFVVIRINPDSALAKDEPSACTAAKRVVRDLANKPGAVIVHPYPVTPFHGDYLHHADRAEAAKAWFAEAGGEPSLPRELRIKVSGRLAQNHPDWSARDGDWDAEVTEIDAAELVASATLAMNGWVTPPWVRAGWFHAERLLSDASGTAQWQRADFDRQRLTTGDFNDLVERINLERDLVATLTAGCRKIVAGYTVKREYFNAEFSAGIENVGYDSIAGLHSPMFLRTVKLKDFPWNGWLALGVDGEPTAAWNPIAGMNDRFGRLLGFAVGDPALMPSPYESGWMLNRIADIPPNAP